MRKVWSPLPSPCSRNSSMKWWKCMQFSLFGTINYYPLGFQKQARCVRSGSDKWSVIPPPLYSVLVQHQLWTQQLGNVQHFHSESGSWSHFLVIKEEENGQEMLLLDKITEILYFQIQTVTFIFILQEMYLRKTTHILMGGKPLWTTSCYESDRARKE